MTGEILSAIKLEDAFFCLDCEIVTNCSDVCPACGNRRLWFLQNWLGRAGDQGKSKYRKPPIEEFQPATQEISRDRAEGSILMCLLTLRKKLLKLEPRWPYPFRQERSRILINKGVDRWRISQ